MTVDWTRLLRGLALLAWAVFFDWLWLSGRASLYVGPRTTWVVVFGAITLTAAAVLYLAGVLTREPAPAPKAVELRSLGVLVAPLLLAIMAPAVSLGAQAVEQKRGANGEALAKRLASDGQEVRLYELAVAKDNPGWAKGRGIEVGMKVEFDGFVSRTAVDGTIELSRFMASCCAADALPYSIDVALPEGTTAPEKNDWVRVRGTVAPRREGVDAVSVEAIERPVDAYG